MRRTIPSLRPPALAASLVELFASADKAESILGDLHEEFSDICSKSGVVTARRWYYRQSVKTFFHLFGAAFRNAPWSLSTIVLVGLLMHWFSATAPERVIMAILRAQRPYSNLHYELYVRLINYGIPIAYVVTSVLVGCVVAVLAKGREVVATLTLIVVRSVPSICLLVFVYEQHADRGPIFAGAFRATVANCWATS